MTDQKATNVTWHDGDVTRADRCNRLGQKGAPCGLLDCLEAAKVLSPLQ